MKSLFGVSLVILLSFGGAAAAQDQDSGDDFIPNDDAVTVVTYIETSAASTARAIGLLHSYREAGRAEPGNSVLELRQEVGQPYRFAIHAQWQDQASFEAHESGTAATQLFDGLSEIQTAPPERIVLQNFAVGPVRASGGGRAQVYGISHIEIFPDRLEDFRALESFMASKRTRYLIVERDGLQEQLQIFGEYFGFDAAGDMQVKAMPPGWQLHAKDRHPHNE